MKRCLIAATLAFALVAGGSRMVLADEGMWTFDNLPTQQLKAQYGFEPSAEWIQHLRSSAVRFNNGGSGSFVSADGLIMTNHHVGADILQKVSTKEKDYYKTGFLAETRDQEIKAPDLELNVLVDIKDVTDEVNASVKPDSSDADAAVARRAASAKIEKDATDSNKLRNDVVTLYQGGKYALYTYKKYTDIRLVMAPEFDIAFFGGDPDNFEYPRYDLDMCFFRAYENDKPAQVKHHLKWSKDGSKAGELTFVAGHPGRTSRLNTVQHLEYFRDRSFPLLLSFLAKKEADLFEFGKRGEEQARQAKEELFSIQNSLKARRGGLQGLQDKALMARKASAEGKLRGNKKDFADAWEKVAKAQEKAESILIPWSLLERSWAFDSELFTLARTLVRLSDEKDKPNSDRLKEFRESGRESLDLALFSEAPIYPEFETFKLAKSLAYLVEKMGADDAIVKSILNGQSPEARASELVKGCKLADVKTRKALAEGGKDAISGSDDSMIQLAKLVDAKARELRKIREDEVEGVEAAQYARIAKARFEEFGNSVYPDATFTLRLAFGVVKGYEVDGKTVAPFTNFEGLFAHSEAHGGKIPYEIPASWHKAKKDGKLALDTPFNFVSTADIIGGNSGSPVVNRDNEVVGLIFDGNIQSLVLDFAYDDQIARAVSVDSRAIIQALRSVYHANVVADELTGK